MDIGIIKESSGGRVLISPLTAKMLIKNGHNVYLSIGAGYQSNYSDEDYLGVGCKVLNNNEDVIYKSNLLTCFSLPEKEIIARMSNKVLLARTLTIDNIEKIRILSKNKNTLIDIEMLKNNEGNFIIRDKISEIESIIAYNIVNYKYNFLNPVSGGKLINNLNFNKKKSVSIVGWNKNGKDIYHLYKNLHCNIYVYDDFTNMSEKEFPEDAWVIPLSEINNITRSDIVFITSRDIYKSSNIGINENIMKKMKKPSVVFMFFKNYVEIPLLENDVDFCFLNLNDSYWGVFDDLSRYNPSDTSPIVSSYLLGFIEKIANSPSVLTNKKSPMIRSVIVLKGRINSIYKFNNKNNIVKQNKIKNPFDLMGLNISSGLENLNDRLSELTDFDL